MDKIQPTSPEPFEAALRLLDARVEAQDAARDDLLKLVGTARRSELIPKMKDARDDLKDLFNHLDKASKGIQSMHRDARFDLFYDDELADKFGSIDESEARKVLTHLTDKSRAILDDRYGDVKTGKPANAHKRRFVRRAREIFDKWNRIKARRSSGNFVQFNEFMYEAATGVRFDGDNWFFHRALNDEFAKRPYEAVKDPS